MQIHHVLLRLLVGRNPGRETQSLRPVRQASYHFRSHNTKKHRNQFQSHLYHLSGITRLTANAANTDCLHPRSSSSHPVGLLLAFLPPSRRDPETAVGDTWGGVCCNVPVHSCESVYNIIYISFVFCGERCLAFICF